MRSFVNKYKKDSKYKISKVTKVSAEVQCTSEHDETSIVEFLKELYDFENEKLDVNIKLDLKGLPVKTLAAAIRYSLTRNDLRNNVMLLNIINLVKVYSILEDEYFKNENVYISNTEELLDVKMELLPEIAAFKRQLSIYFFSLFKSYNKIAYTQTDVVEKLPSIYELFILSTDILTLSAIFASLKNSAFSTDDCVFLERGGDIASALLLKSSIGLGMMNMFFNEHINEKPSLWKRLFNRK